MTTYSIGFIEFFQSNLTRIVPYGIQLVNLVMGVYSRLVYIVFLALRLRWFSALFLS
jgi:hypothetical protein